MCMDSIRLIPLVNGMKTLAHTQSSSLNVGAGSKPKNLDKLSPKIQTVKTQKANDRACAIVFTPLTKGISRIESMHITRHLYPVGTHPHLKYNLRI